jgi:hypothetical protein
MQYPSDSKRSLDPNTIPYIKLHGSFNWRTSSDPHSELMIVGSQKEEQMKENPLIKWYFDIFLEKLSSPGSRLLILGHSLLDPHINRIIFEAVQAEKLRFYIWNPSGLDGVIKNLKSINQYEHDLFYKGVIGVSTKSLQEMLKDESLMKSELCRIQREFFAS